MNCASVEVPVKEPDREVHLEYHDDSFTLTMSLLASQGGDIPVVLTATLGREEFREFMDRLNVLEDFAAIDSPTSELLE